MGTNNGNALPSEKSSALSDNLSGQAWKALADAAAALQAAASAIAGINGQNGGTICHTSSSDPVTVADAINEFLRAKARAGRSDRYLRALRVSLNSFKNGRSREPIGSVKVTDIERWLEAHNWSPRTQRGYVSDVRVLFNFLIRRGLAKENPAAAVELPEFEEAPPKVHPPDHIRAALEFARSYDLNLCRALAIRFFAGLRSCELDRSGEEHILAGHIEVTAANAKRKRKRQRRLVTIQSNLRAWLALGGSIDFGNGGQRWASFVKALQAKTGLEWPDNVTRHTFASYHLAQFKNAGQTALETGHTEQMLFSNYREVQTITGQLITPELAQEFWGIRPKPTLQVELFLSP